MLEILLSCLWCCPIEKKELYVLFMYILSMLYTRTLGELLFTPTRTAKTFLTRYFLTVHNMYNISILHLLHTCLCIYIHFEHSRIIYTTTSIS